MEFVSLNLPIIIKSSLKFEMPHYPDEIEYSDKYQDDHYEYRHVLLPRETYKKVPRNKLLQENVIIFVI